MTFPWPFSPAPGELPSLLPTQSSPVLGPGLLLGFGGTLSLVASSKEVRGDECVSDRACLKRTASSSRAVSCQTQNSRLEIAARNRKAGEARAPVPGARRCRRVLGSSSCVCDGLGLDT